MKEDGRKVKIIQIKDEADGLGLTLALSLTSCVTLGKLLNFPVVWVLHLSIVIIVPIA